MYIYQVINIYYAWRNTAQSYTTEMEPALHVWTLRPITIKYFRELHNIIGSIDRCLRNWCWIAEDLTCIRRHELSEIKSDRDKANGWAAKCFFIKCITKKTCWATMKDFSALPLEGGFKSPRRLCWFLWSICHTHKTLSLSFLSMSYFYDHLPAMVKLCLWPQISECCACVKCQAKLLLSHTFWA